MKQIELKALAKINLGLDVLGRRENGYHDVRMIMPHEISFVKIHISKYSTQILTHAIYCGKVKMN